METVIGIIAIIREVPFGVEKIDTGPPQSTQYQNDVIPEPATVAFTTTGLVQYTVPFDGSFICIHGVVGIGVSTVKETLERAMEPRVLLV